MKQRVLWEASSFAGLLLGCGDILGLDDNKPAFSCQCPTGQVCDDARLACVPGAGAGGARASNSFASGSTQVSLGGMLITTTLPNPSSGGVGNGGTTNSIGGNGSDSGGTSTSTSPGGTGGYSFGGTAAGGATTPEITLGGLGGATSGGTAGGSVGGMGGTLGGNAGAAGSGANCLTVIPEILPVPCRGAKYDLLFTVLKGTPPYTWEALSEVLDLTLEKDGHLHGIATQAGTLVARVTDSTGACSSVVAFALQPRDKCWLAYTSKESGREELHLLDAELHSYLYDPEADSRYTRKMFPLVFPSAGDTAVQSFRFSPDGRYLTYLLDGSPARLVLLAAPEWREIPLEFPEGSVVTYAWSPDSSVLAVALGDKTTPDKLLGGVRVNSTASQGLGGAAGSAGATSIPTSGAAGAPSAVGITKLLAIEARIQSELTWIDGGRLVAFHAPLDEPDSVTMVHVAQLTPSGFDHDVELDAQEYEPQSGELPPIHLTSGARGFWVVGSERGVDFWLLPEDPSVVVRPSNTHCYAHGKAYLAPSGRHTARVEVNQGVPLLQVFDGKNPKSSLSTPQKCPQFLGWSTESAGRELLACLAQEGESSEVQLFELTNSQLLGASAVRGNYFYTDAMWYRRTFSPAGKWFSFASPKDLYVATLGSGSPSLFAEEFKHEAFTKGLNLTFSPDENWLLEHRGIQLIVHSLIPTGGVSTPYAINERGLLQPEPCEEDPWDEPYNWCGTGGSSGSPAWSTDSQWAVFLTDGGVLQLLRFQLSPKPHASLPFSLPSGCASDCATQYSFQP